MLHSRGHSEVFPDYDVRIVETRITEKEKERKVIEGTERGMEGKKRREALSGTVMLIWRCASVRLEPTHESGMRVCVKVCVFLRPILGNTADGSRTHVSPWGSFTQDWWVRFYSSLSSVRPICSLSPHFLYSNLHAEHSSGDMDDKRGWVRIFSNWLWIFHLHYFLKEKCFISVPLITPNGLQKFCYA